MLYLNQTRPQAGRVNLKELQEVREHHLPAQQVRFAKLCQLERVASEVNHQHPHLREETAFVVQEERGRRQRLAQPMVAVKGEQPS